MQSAKGHAEKPCGIPNQFLTQWVHPAAGKIRLKKSIRQNTALSLLIS